MTTAVIAPGVTSSVANDPNDIGFVNFANGTNQVPSLSNYASGFNVALNSPAWVIFADNNSAGVRALGAEHVQLASSPPVRSWRRFITGSALNEFATTAENNARNTNQLNVTYCWPGIQRTNITTGLNQVYDGLHVAAAIAGMMTGNPVPTPLTNKTLIGNGIEQITDIATYGNLQNNGVLTLSFPNDTKIPTLLTDVTTWQNDSVAANVFNQEVACRYALAYYTVRTLNQYCGTIASNITIVNPRNAYIALLNSLIYSSVNSVGILNSWDPNSLIVKFIGTGQVLQVTVNVVFVGQIRFITVNVTVNPLNIQVSSAGIITNV